MSKNPRDYGFGDAPKVVGVPVIGEKLSAKCPHCGCVGLFAVEVEVANPSPLLKRPEWPHKVVGRYMGCAACPWASPMMTSVVLSEPF
jgi:hypothetical protein